MEIQNKKKKILGGKNQTTRLLKDPFRKLDHLKIKKKVKKVQIGETVETKIKTAKRKATISIN